MGLKPETPYTLQALNRTNSKAQTPQTLSPEPHSPLQMLELRFAALKVDAVLVHLGELQGSAA